MRPLARNYLQHGRRHGPEGSDPIPTFDNLPILAYGANTVSLVSVPHGTTVKYPMTDQHVTSDSSKVAWITTTTANDTISLIGSGFAMLTVGVRWTGGTNIDAKIVTGSGFELFPHDGFKNFSGFGSASPSNVMPTLMDVCWIATTASPSLPVWVELTNSDGSDSTPQAVNVGCVFYPNLTGF